MIAIAAKLITYSNRINPIKSGYRPLFLINESYYSGAVFFDGADIGQNETRNVDINFISFAGQLNKGDVIKFFESPNSEIGEVLII